MASRRPVTAWCFTDGKAGHANQVQGMLAALRRRIPVNDCAIDARGVHRPLRSLMTGRLAYGHDLPDPDFLVGAGHATHLPMLAARRARGGHVIVLMRPSLPLSLFDLCVIPEHDRPPARANVMTTRGVLNRVARGDAQDPAAGLFLVGGPSPHVDWSSERVIDEVLAVVAHTPGVRWQLATSRRTPAGFLEQLGRRTPAGNLTVVPVESTGPDWLPEQLGRAATVWVTADSVSMVYEALTAGAAVGVLGVAYRKPGDRLAAGLQALQADGRVTDFETWRGSHTLPPAGSPLDEAGRVAERILATWPPGN